MVTANSDLYMDQLQQLHQILKEYEAIFATLSSSPPHKIQDHRISLIEDPSKLEAIAKWPIPTSVKALKGFLRLTSYYMKFIPDFGKITGPLTALTKKDNFSWTQDTIDAFHTLKQAMLTPQVLALPNFTKPFIIESDASGTGIGAVLQ
ncbi:uncharacterized mitochondrial protein AtMg00860-like [Pyrus communis]|uniref:uncharacterized mitochondrial protein AtMg00860-like n=1 Tax=Pyrus communis TaxID=23211 RepID=UPI0035BF16D4